MKREAAMSMFKNTATFAFKLGAGLLLVSSCDNLGSDCEYLKTCPSGGAGGSSGSTASGGDAGASSLGGSSTTGGRGDAGGSAAGESGAAGAGGGAGGAAGAAGASGAAGNGGEGGAPPCDDACGEATPICEPVSNQCVECRVNEDCSASAEPSCDTTTNTCVECLEQADCKSPTASRCDLTDHTCNPCSIDADCSDIDGKGVCLAGTCVECTTTKATACGSEKGTPLVCDSLEHTCTTKPARSAGLCQPCVADAQCALGQLCVLDTIGSGTSQKEVGYFCRWKQGDTANGAPADCPTEGRPYVKLVADAVSVDGETAGICALAISTCPAKNEFRDKNCAPTGVANDALCGVSSPNDAKCVQFGAGFRCTMTCLSQDDCPSPSTCNTGVTPQVCTL